HLHLVAEIGGDPLHAAIHLGGDGDLLHAGERTADLDHLFHRLGAQLLYADRKRPASTRRPGITGAGNEEREEDHDRYEPFHPSLHRPSRRSNRAREIERSRALCTRSARAVASCDWASASSRAEPNPVW